MVSQGDRVVVLYPLYFDATRSRHEGRRVSKKLAVRGPTVDDVAEAARRAKYRVEVEAGAAHPARPWKGEGRVLIVGGGRKTEILQAVARQLRGQKS